MPKAQSGLSQKNKKKCTLLFIFLLLSAGLFFAIKIKGIAEVDATGLRSSDTVTPQALDSTTDNTAQKTVGSEWQWDNVYKVTETKKNQTPAMNTSKVIFDIPAVYAKLQEVRVDENGDVILDSIALKALNETLDYSNFDLNQIDLGNLQQIIRMGLPGSTGKQTAEFVGNYYRYLQARDELDALYRDADTPAALDTQFQERQALREMYLGQQAAEQLFREQDSEERYMMDSMLLAADPRLSAEEASQQQKIIDEQHHEAYPPVANWQSRYRAFSAQKKLIMDAGLSPEESEHQIEELRKNQFTEDELHIARTHGMLTGDGTQH